MSPSVAAHGCAPSNQGTPAAAARQGHPTKPLGRGANAAGGGIGARRSAHAAARAAAGGLALLLVATAVCAAGGTGPYEFTLKARKFDERCVRLAAGEAIRYRFVASAPVDFNIHYHRGEQVVYPVRRNGVTDADNTFRAEHADDYCLMWQATATGAVTVRGTMGRIPARRSKPGS